MYCSPIVVLPTLMKSPTDKVAKTVLACVLASANVPVAEFAKAKRIIVLPTSVVKVPAATLALPPLRLAVALNAVAESQTEIFSELPTKPGYLAIYLISEAIVKLL